MIKLNFIAQNQRKSRGGAFDEGFGSLPREVFIGVVLAAAVFLIMIHIVLGSVALAKMTQYSLLQKQWTAMAPDKNVLDAIVEDTKGMQTSLLALKGVTAIQGVLWGKVLNDVSDSVPKGLWLRDFRFEQDDLTIDGSAVSKVKNEMIIANSFVAALKSRSSIKDNFLSLDVDAIERRDIGIVSIADFTLKAKRKSP